MPSHGKVRRSQVISTWGPGALIDLPYYAAIVGGLETWPYQTLLEEVEEPRLTRKLHQMTDVRFPRLYSPPASSDDRDENNHGIGAWRFPEWFLVQDDSHDRENRRARRLVRRSALDNRSKFEKHSVVPIRFVRACPKGHVDDVDWISYVHRDDRHCGRPLWLEEHGTSGDLGDLTLKCDCGKSRKLSEATQLDTNPLGTCEGARPWLGRHAHEDCTQPSRLLTRTAANAYFPQVISVLSIPEQEPPLLGIIAELWEYLQIVEEIADLRLVKRQAKVAEKIIGYSDAEIFEAIQEHRKGRSREERPIKQVELDAILAAPEGYGDDVPVDLNFHARILPERSWRKPGSLPGIAAVIQLHRLREVLALTGFTRFEAVTPDIDGEYESDVERASLALEPAWFPAVENRGEGLFLQLDSQAVQDWLGRPAVINRLNQLTAGHLKWREGRKSQRDFPGGPYVLLHTLSHLLLQSLSMRCGYPGSAIRERIYVDTEGGRYGLLLYTGTPDADGTLGGLVQQARHMDSHLRYALRTGALCSNDPICAQHAPGTSLEHRHLHGAACHGCALVSEPSCEMRNEYLDRALVIPTLSLSDTAFFSERQ